MEEPAPTCMRCGADIRVGESCATCLAELPPLLDRGDKWSPLAIATFSIFCDPCLIPSLTAGVRGFQELREVDRRERAGIYREEHATVRTGAVWAIVIAAARPLLVLVAFATAALAGALEPPPYPGHRVDEVAEILERLPSEDPATRTMAAAHLGEIGPELGTRDVRRVLDAIERGFGHDEETERALRGQAVIAIARAAPFSEHRERFELLYPTLPAPARQVVLERLVAIGDPRALHTFAELAGADRDPEGPTLSESALLEQRAHAAIFVPPLVRLPEQAKLREDVPSLLSALCRGGLDEGVLEPVRDRLIADAREASSSVGEPWSVLRDRMRSSAAPIDARHRVDALACLSGDDVDALLFELSAHPDTFVAVGAARGLIARGKPVPRRAIVRLAADPFSRADLFEALAAHGGERQMPTAQRSDRALAESALLRSAYLASDPWLSYVWRARVEVRPDASMHVFAVTRERGGLSATEHVAVGFYPAARGTEPVVIQSHYDEDTHARVLEALSEQEEVP